VLVSLPAGFTFDATGLPAVGNLAIAGGGGTIGAITIFSGGLATAGNNTFVKYFVPVATDYVTAPTLTLSTAAWVVKDANGTLSGTAPATVQLAVQTLDAGTNIEFDAGSNSANWISAVNAFTISIAATDAVVDTAPASARKNFVVGRAGSTDTLTQDNDATISIKVGDSTGVNPVHDNLGALYTPTATDSITITTSGLVAGVAQGALSGLASVVFNPGAASQITDTVTTTPVDEVTNNTTVLTIPGNNAAIPANGAVAAVIPLRIVVNGTTQLTARTLTVSVDTVIAYNAANNKNYVPAGTTLSAWTVNGTVLLSNWNNANTTAWKSRFYIWNPSSTANATVSARIFSIPVAGMGVGAQIGNTVVLSSTLGAVSGMTIKLEDLVTASGGTPTQIQGPDGSYNVAVELTIFALNVTGYTQTFNLAGTMAFGTTPMQKIQ